MAGIFYLRMHFWSMGQYVLLCAASFRKTRWSVERFAFRLLICLVELLLCAGGSESGGGLRDGFQ